LNISAWLGIAAVVLGTIPTFVHLFDLPLEARLTIVGTLGLMGVIAILMAPPHKQERKAGFYPTKQGASTIWNHVHTIFERFWQVPLLAAMIVFSVLLFWTTLWYHNVHVRIPSAEEHSADFLSPHVELASMEVQLKESCDCSPSDIANRDRSEIEIVYSGGRNTGLRLSQFNYPQAFALRCKDKIVRECISGLKAVPSTARFIWSPELRAYTITAIVIGGVLWLIASSYVVWRARQ
jgi:hypothetical protein